MADVRWQMANRVCRLSLPVPAKRITYARVSTNTLTEIRKVRLGKADALRKLGLSPYPSRSRRTHYAKAILDDFPALIRIGIR